jgi:hypothetical protein
MIYFQLYLLLRNGPHDLRATGQSACNKSTVSSEDRETSCRMLYLEWRRTWEVLCSEPAVLRSATAPKTSFDAPIVEIDLVKFKLILLGPIRCLVQNDSLFLAISDIIVAAVLLPCILAIFFEWLITIRELTPCSFPRPQQIVLVFLSFNGLSYTSWLLLYI